MYSTSRYETCILQTAIFKVASLVSKQNLLPITV